MALVGAFECRLILRPAQDISCINCDCADRNWSLQLRLYIHHHFVHRLEILRRWRIRRRARDNQYQHVVALAVEAFRRLEILARHVQIGDAAARFEYYIAAAAAVAAIWTAELDPRVSKSRRAAMTQKQQENMKSHRYRSGILENATQETR